MEKLKIIIFSFTSFLFVSCAAQNNERFYKAVIENDENNFKVYSQEKIEIKVKELNSSMKQNNTLLSNKRFSFIKEEISDLNVGLLDILADSLGSTKNIILHVEFLQSYGYSIGTPTYIFYVYDVNSKKEWIYKYEKKSKKNNFNIIEKSTLPERDIEYYKCISYMDVDKLIKLSNSYKLRFSNPNDIEFEFAEFIYYLNYEENEFNANNFMLHFPLSVEKEFE